MLQYILGFIVVLGFSTLGFAQDGVMLKPLFEISAGNDIANYKSNFNAQTTFGSQLIIDNAEAALFLKAQTPADKSLYLITNNTFSLNVSESYFAYGTEVQLGLGKKNNYSYLHNWQNSSLLTFLPLPNYGMGFFTNVNSPYQIPVKVSLSLLSKNFIMDISFAVEPFYLGLRFILGNTYDFWIENNTEKLKVGGWLRVLNTNKLGSARNFSTSDMRTAATMRYLVSPNLFITSALLGRSAITTNGNTNNRINMSQLSALLGLERNCANFTITTEAIIVNSKKVKPQWQPLEPLMRFLFTWKA